MADKDDKDTSYGGSQGNRGSNYGGSPGSGGSYAGQDRAPSAASSGRNNSGSHAAERGVDRSVSGGGYGSSPGGSSSPGYGWGGSHASERGRDFSLGRGPNTSVSSGGHGTERGRDFSLGRSPNTPAPGAIGGGVNAERERDFSLGRRANTPTGFGGTVDRSVLDAMLSDYRDKHLGATAATGPSRIDFNPDRFGGLPQGFNTDRFAPDIPAPTGSTGSYINAPTTPTQYTPGRFGMAVPPATGRTMAEQLKNLEESMEPDPNPANPMNQRTQREVLEDEQNAPYENPYNPNTTTPVGMTERAALGTTDPKTGLPARANAPGTSWAGTETAPASLPGRAVSAAPPAGSYNPSTGIVGDTIDPNQFSNPAMYGAAARAAENQSMRDLENMNVPGNSMAGTERTPKGLGNSMAGTETSPAHAGVGPTGYSLDNRNRMTPAMGGVASGLGPTTDLPTGTRIGEIKSMGDMAKYQTRQRVMAVEAGTTDPYNRMVEGGPVDYNKGLSDGSMTLDDIREMQSGMKAKGYASTAVGPYQTIAKTLNSSAARLGLPGNTVMTEKVWDAIGDDLIDNRVRQATEMKGGLTPKNLGHQLANEWAAFASPKTGKGVHDKVGNNRASVPAAQVEAYARDFINNTYTKDFADKYLGTTGGVPAGSAVPTVSTGTPTTPAAPESTTPAPRSAPAAAGGTVTATEPGTAGFPATPPKQAQAPGFPSRKTPATDYKRSGLGTVLGLGIDAGLTVAGGPVSLGINLLSGLAFGDSVGGLVADAVGGKYGPNQYAPGADDRYSGDRAGGVGSGGENTRRGVNNPKTIGNGTTTPAATTAPVTPPAEEFIDKYIDPPYPTPFENWGEAFGWSKEI